MSILVEGLGFPGGSDCVCLQCGRPGFDSWVGKIPWSRKWQSTPVFLPEKSHGQGGQVGYSPWCHKESDMTEWLSMHTWLRLVLSLLCEWWNWGSDWLSNLPKVTQQQSWDANTSLADCEALSLFSTVWYCFLMQLPLCFHGFLVILYQSWH